MPEVKDAIELIADPANVHTSDDHTGERKIKWKQIVKLLKKDGAQPAEARQLIIDAVQELDGHVDPEVRGKKTEFVGFVPADKVRRY